MVEHWSSMVEQGRARSSKVEHKVEQRSSKGRARSSKVEQRYKYGSRFQSFEFWRPWFLSLSFPSKRRILD